MVTLRSVLTGLMAVAVMLTSCVACTSAAPVATTGSDAVSISSPAMEISGQLPAGVTPELEAAAVAALAAFENYSRIVVATQQSPIGIGGDPNQPWEPEIRTYVADPAADAMVERTASLANGGVHRVMPVTYDDARVTAVTLVSATVVVCADLGAATAADNHDEPVAIPVTDLPRRALTFGLRPFPEKGWLVDHDDQSEPPVPCR